MECHQRNRRLRCTNNFAVPLSETAVTANHRTDRTAWQLNCFGCNDHKGKEKNTKQKAEQTFNLLFAQPQVSAFVKNIYGRASSITVALKGVPLAEVRHLKIMNDVSEVMIHWDPPSDSPQPNLTYGIYYGTSWDELSESKSYKKSD